MGKSTATKKYFFKEVQFMMLVVFENAEERATKGAGMCHDFDAQPNLFGKEAAKLLQACKKLCHVALRMCEGDMDKLQAKIYGIAKSHGCRIVWYGNPPGPCEPDRFLIFKKKEEVGFIQV